MNTKSKLLKSWVLGTFVGMAAALLPAAADYTVEVKPTAPPEEVSRGMSAVLDNQAVIVLKDGQPVYEFWFRKPLQVRKEPDSMDDALDYLKPAAFIGIVRVDADLRDYRDDDLKSGVYTMRFGNIPEDDNHKEVAEFETFVVLIPATLDQREVGIRTFEVMTETSSDETVTEHPVVLSLRPIDNITDPIPRVEKPAPNHTSIVVSTPALAFRKRDEFDLAFQIVVEGKGILKTKNEKKK